MRVAGVARSIGLTLASVILAVSGIYVVVDLARWEWNRALISALVFVAALVVVVSMSILRQLRRLEERVVTLAEQRQESGGVAGTLRAANAESSSRRFHWLEQPPDRLGVFIPVLLGAGVVMSFVAYVIERVAGAFASATIDRVTVRQLDSALPLGDGLADESTHPRAGPARHPVAVAVVAVVSVLLSLAAIEGLRQLTQTRPDEITTFGTTTIVVGIEQRRTADPAVVVAGDLWGACRSRLPGGITVLSILPSGPDEATIAIDRALGRTGRLRIVGCLQDHTMDLVRADVREVYAVPLER